MVGLQNKETASAVFLLPEGSFSFSGRLYGAPREIGNNLSTSARAGSLKTENPGVAVVSEVFYTGGDRGFRFSFSANLTALQLC